MIPCQGLPDAVVRLGGPFWAVRLHAGADSAAVARALRSDSAGRLGVDRPIEFAATRGGRHPSRRLRHHAAAAGARVRELADPAADLDPRARARLRDPPSIGATPRQVLATVVAGGSSLALPATLVGLPLGTWMFLFMIGVTDPADGPDVATLPSCWWFPLVLPAALGLTAFVSLLVARQATRIHPAPALRAE